MTKRALFIYDKTGFAAKPWLDAGYECWLFDGQHKPGIWQDGNNPLLVRVGMWFDPYKIHGHVRQFLKMVPSADIVIGFPECTELTNAGSGSWERKRLENPRFQDEAVDLARLVRLVGEAFNCPWMFENPVGKMSTLYGPANFWFNPCDYGGYLPATDTHPLYPLIYPGQDAYNKKTGIWCGNGFVKPPLKRIEPLFKANPGWKLCGGKSLRTKNIRSCTPRGFANAVFEYNGSTTYPDSGG